MEELYRRVSDRQTMGSVVQELRASLSEVEKSIDKFFRNPSDASVLHDVPVQLELDARRPLGARRRRRVAGAAAHARRDRRPGDDRGRSREDRSRRASSSASPATSPRSAS
jgi:chemosensory pili system protein ChpA (sensor histidine kinase/response regulator)